MPINVPPALLAPEFVVNGYRFNAVGTQRQFLMGNSSRVALIFSNFPGSIIIAPQQQMISGGGGITIPTAAAPYLLHFRDVGAFISGPLWDSGIATFDVTEILWKPREQKVP